MRFSFATLAFCVAILALDSAILRSYPSSREMWLGLFCLPTLNILAFAGYRGLALRRSGKPAPFLHGFQRVGWMAVIAYLLWCWILPGQASGAFAVATEQVYWLTLDHLDFDTMKYHDPTFRLAWRISKATQGIIASGMLTCVIMFAATCGGTMALRQCRRRSAPGLSA